MQEEVRLRTWWIKGLGVDLSNVPYDVVHLEAWSEFWRDLRSAQELPSSARQAGLLRLAEENFIFVFSSRAFDVKRQRLFSRRFDVMGHFKQVRGRLWVSDPGSLESAGRLTISAIVRLSIPFANANTAQEFQAQLEDDWIDVWEKAALSGPEAFDQEYPVVGYGLKFQIGLGQGRISYAA